MRGRCGGRAPAEGVGWDLGPAAGGDFPLKIHRYYFHGQSGIKLYFAVFGISVDRACYRIWGKGKNGGMTRSMAYILNSLPR
jgi:hypothetical protein